MHLPDSMYTKSELTEKKYTVGQAFASAKARLKEKHGLTKVCVNAIPSWMSMSHPITLAELNDYAQKMYEDTCYHDLGW